MADLILHHYPTSPFSEKVRLVFGYKKLAWKSVIVPQIMPKPDVLALTGGYRKTPFLQIGSDIFCDTALICDVLEHMAPSPTLYPEKHKGMARVLAQWADEKLFWAAMAYNFSPAGAAQMFAGAPPQAAQAFAEDRAKMRSGLPRMPLGDATAAYKSYLRRIANMLDGQDFLLGSAPCIADFATYHPLWFTRTRTSVMAPILDAHPGVLAWMDRMAAFGHDRCEPMTATQSIAMSQANTLAGNGFASILPSEPFQDEHGIALGSEVSITSESFGLEPTQGSLVAATRMHYTLRRHDERAGLVQVHFPRMGYILKKAEK